MRQLNNGCFLDKQQGTNDSLTRCRYWLCSDRFESRDGFGLGHEHDERAEMRKRDCFEGLLCWVYILVLLLTYTSLHNSLNEATVRRIYLNFSNWSTYSELTCKYYIMAPALEKEIFLVTGTNLVSALVATNFEHWPLQERQMVSA